MSLQNSRQISDVKVMLKVGADGAGIADIEKTGTSGLVDTYTITLDDGRKKTFTVTNGNGITGIELTGTSGLVDTYTITFDNGDTETFEVTNGNYIEDIEKTSSVGLVDTYTIHMVDGTEYTFTVTNGSNATGSNIVVSTQDAELIGRNVSISQNGTVLQTLQFDSSGFANFRGIEATGTLDISSSASGGATVTKQISVPYFGNYDTAIALFRATIALTAPSNASVDCSGGTESYYGTGSTTFTVHSAGTFTLGASIDGQRKTTTVTITTDGESQTATIEFGEIDVTLESGFVGSSITCTNGTDTIVKTASTASLTFYPPTTGTWNIIGSIGGTAFTVSATVSSLSTPVSVSLASYITVTVTMHGAKGATITYTDANGAQTVTLDSTGLRTGISITATPNTPITFTDTNMAKNPDNLTQNYTKDVTITAGMTDLYVMPEKSIYWYGNKNNFGVMTSANMWTNTNLVNNYSEDYNYVSCPFYRTQNVNKYCGIASINTISCNNNVAKTIMRCNLSGSYSPTMNPIPFGNAVKTRNPYEYAKYDGNVSGDIHVNTSDPLTGDLYVGLCMQIDGQTQNRIYALWVE